MRGPESYQNEAWLFGQPIRRKALLLGGIGTVLGVTEGFKGVIRFWQMTTPLPPCLDSSGKDISFKVIPCRLPEPFITVDPYSDPVKVAQELLKVEQDP